MTNPSQHRQHYLDTTTKNWAPFDPKARRRVDLGVWVVGTESTKEVAAVAGIKGVCHRPFLFRRAGPTTGGHTTDTGGNGVASLNGGSSSIGQVTHSHALLLTCVQDLLSISFAGAALIRQCPFTLATSRHREKSKETRSRRGITEIPDRVRDHGSMTTSQAEWRC